MYIIHYFAGATYDGADVLETEHEYYARKTYRKDEGWQRIGSYRSGDDQVLIMQMSEKKVIA